MLDVPSLGQDLLLRVQSRVAENCPDADEFEAVDTIIEALKMLVEPTELRRGILATARSSADKIRREKDVLHALTDTLVARDMR